MAQTRSIAATSQAFDAYASLSQCVCVCVCVCVLDAVLRLDHPPVRAGEDGRSHRGKRACDKCRGRVTMRSTTVPASRETR